MNKRNFGVVIKFSDTTCNNYGFIKSFFNSKDIFFHRSFILSGTPKAGDLGSFELVPSARGLRGEKVLVLNEQTLAKEIDFSDAESYEKIRKGIFLTKGSNFFKKFLSAVSEENLRNYAWLRKDLSFREHVELCLKMFREEPAPELEAELESAIKNVGKIKFSLPIELAIKENFWIHGDKTSKIAALKNFAANLSAEELFKIIYKHDEELSIAEMATILQGVIGNEKFSAIGEAYAQGNAFNDWAKIILENDLPNEIIFTHWHKLNKENKFAVLEKYFDMLTTEKIISLSKNLPPKEIIRVIKDKKTFSEKISAMINDSNRENDWANYLIDDIELFKAVNLCDDVIIFFVYAFVKCKKDLNVLADALLAKTEIIKSSLRLKVVCRYVWAAYKKFLNDIPAAEKAKSAAESALMGIFNEITERLESVTENGEEFEFTEHKAYILPPCTVEIFKDCHFCEAVAWPEKVEDESGNITWKLGRNYCPRLSCSDKHCFRIEPNLNLPSEKWSIVELTKALGLMQYETQQELEFFMRIGGEFNRIYDLQKNLKCRVCGKYMRSIKKNARWKKVFNLRDLTWKNHFAIFNATTFSCQNENCSEHGKPVYMSYCWHCGERIDSRDSHVRIGKEFIDYQTDKKIFRGYYSCIHCGAGYRDVALNENRVRYALFPATICPSCTKCPNCGGQEFEILEMNDGFSLKCRKCSEIFVPKTTLHTEKGHNFYCTRDECNQKLKILPETLRRDAERLCLKPIQ